MLGRREQGTAEIQAIGEWTRVQMPMFVVATSRTRPTALASDIRYIPNGVTVSSCLWSGNGRA